MVSNAPSARDIIQCVVDRYARIKSYRDHGFVRNRLTGDDPRQRLTFETNYLAPNLFRFQFVSPHPYRPLSHIKTRCVVGSDGTTAYLLTERQNPPVRLSVERDLGLAVAAATGISSGSAHSIARLLLREARGFALTELEDLALTGEMEVNGHTCFAIAGSNPHGATHEILVEKDTFLLHSLSTLHYKDIREKTRVNERLNVDGKWNDALIAKDHFLRRSFSGYHHEEIREDIRVDEPLDVERFRLPEGEA